jgi:Bacterial type II and III secretion system protein
MTCFFRLACVTLLVLASLTLPTAAQPAAQPASRAATALMLDVAIARYQGDKRVSNLPYSLAVNADNEPSRLRIGGQVPVASPTITGDGKAPPATLSYSYRDIGTSIDARAAALDDGRFKVLITVDDTSVYADADNPGGTKGAPSFRSFRSNNTLMLRDGQTAEFTTATDRISGEVTKVTVKLTVMK